ncbi:hypothetical protein [Polaromonas sp. CG9_12]|nr:hypothetical protein [Polaromonas sp. CG9_12]
MTPARRCSGHGLTGRQTIHRFACRASGFAGGLADWLSAGQGVLPEDAKPPNAGELAAIVYTSGTTGKPKGVMHDACERGLQRARHPGARGADGRRCVFVLPAAVAHLRAHDRLLACRWPLAVAWPMRGRWRCWQKTSRPCGRRC